MPQRSKSSIKSDSSQTDAVSQRRTTKRLRIDSDEDGDEGYEPHQERRPVYNESYTRGGAGSSSPPPKGRSVSTSKRQKLPLPEDEEDSEPEYRVRDFEDPPEVLSGPEEEEWEQEYRQGHSDGDDDDDRKYRGGGGRPRKKRRTPVSSPLSWKDSSPPPAPAPHATSSTAEHGQSGGGRPHKLSFKAKALYAAQTATPTTATASSSKKSTAKGKQKAQSTSGSKRKRKQEVESGDEEEYNDYEGEDMNVDEDEEDEAKFSDEYDDYEEDEGPTKGKKGRGGGGRGTKVREKEKEKDTAPILKKAKFEGAPPATGSSATSTKRTRARQLVEEDTVVDIMDETGTPEASSIGSPTIPATAAADGAKEEPPQKKRKLPTIKKLKNSTSLGGATAGSGTGTDPSTPSSGLAGSKAPPSSGGLTANGASNLGIDKAARPKTTATTDLDLSNPSLYAELFKNPGGGASKTGLNRRAKEEERKKELDKLRDDYKAKFAEEVKKSFDLQGQAEKMARFEEVLRQRRSSALYPNFLAAKWREEWEREKRRAHKREYQQQPVQNGHVDNTKEEGEM